MKFNNCLVAIVAIVVVLSGTQTHAAPFGGFFARLFGARCCQQTIGASPCGPACSIRATKRATACGSNCFCSGGAVEEEEEYAPGLDELDVVSPCDSVEALDAGIEEETNVESADEPSVERCAACSELESRLVAAAIRARGRALLTDCRLCQWARRNSELQARYGSVGHFAGGAWEIAAPGRTPEEAVQAWLNSPTHRRILLGGFSKVGAGAARSANGVIFWTLRFE